MADSRSIIIDTTTQNGIKKQKSFTDVDPEATAVEMLNFANAAVALTTDTFRAASYVDKEYLSGGSIMKEQLRTRDNTYSKTIDYPANATEAYVGLDIYHSDNRNMSWREACTLPISIKTYDTDVFARINVSKLSQSMSVVLYPTTTEQQQNANNYGINQATTPDAIQPQTVTKGAGRVEVTVHDTAIYRGFTYTININAHA